jgi:hypothetical protein
VTTQFAAQAALNANVTDALAAAQAAQAEQASAQAAAMGNVTGTLTAVLGGLSALQTSVGALATRMEAVEANNMMVAITPPSCDAPGGLYLRFTTSGVRTRSHLLGPHALLAPR